MTTTPNRKRRGRRLVAACGAIAAGAALMAPAAGADIRKCSDFGFDGSDSQSRCSTITGIDPGSSLRIRARPSLSAPIVGRLRNRDVIEVDCWSIGDPVRGDRFWVGIYGGGGPTYVPDYYVATGRPSVWTQQFTRCP
jgi:hypothetical protein